jgi:alpha-L-fucosidase
MKNFEPSFESLRRFECPQWFRDAKFGIWSHWGPQSVPMYGDWYARFMYMQDTPQYRYHLRRYGHPSKFGYKDICKLWKAERFDPDALMALYKKAGARYFVAQAMHHDNFFNFKTRLNRFNSVDMGPRKDICGLWKKAADAQGLPFGLTEHLGASYYWTAPSKGADAYGPYKGVPYDGADPRYADFYHDFADSAFDVVKDGKYLKMTDNPQFHKYWLDTMKELIDNYAPDFL